MIQRTLVFAVLMLTVASVIYAQDGDIKEMSLQECIEFALQNNENIKNAVLEKDIAEAQVKETIGLGLPQANLNAGMNYNYKVPTQLVDPNSFGIGGDSSSNQSGEQSEDLELQFGQSNDANLAFSVQQLIFDGSYFVGLRAARTFKELSSKELVKSKIDVVSAVSKAYYNVLISRQRMELMDKNFQRLDTLLRQTDALLKTGFAETSDFSRIKIQYNKLKVENEKVKRLFNLSERLLKYQMGMSLSTSINLSDDLSSIQMDKMASDTSGFNYYQRIEYSQLQTNEALVNLDMENDRVQRLPKVYANFNYGSNTAGGSFGDVFDTDRWFGFGSVGLTISMPIFDGFIKRYKIQQKKIQIEQIQNSKVLLEKSIDLEIEQSLINLESSLKMLAAEKENLDLTEQVYNSASIKYKEGVGSSLELTEAETGLKEAQTNYFNAMYDAITYKIDLEKALGILYNE